jgi:hypothetical protein
MKKKRPTILPDPVFTFNDTTIVMLRTRDYAFQLAIFLNEAYLLQLARIDDLYLNDTPYPCFFFHDEAAWLVYILIARPFQTIADPAFGDYDKMLLIRGRDSRRFPKMLYDQMRNRRYGNAIGPAAEPDPTDLVAHRQWEICNQLSESIQQLDMFDFKNPLQPVSTLRLTHVEPTLFPVESSVANATEQRAIANYHRQLQSFLGQTFDALHAHLTVVNGES